MRRLLRLTRHWELKLVALVFALLLWSVTKAEQTRRIAVPGVRVQVALRDPGWTMAAPPVPESVTVVVSGPVRELIQVLADPPLVVVPVEDVSDSLAVRRIRETWVQHPRARGLRVEEIRPPEVRLSFARVTRPAAETPAARDRRQRR